MPTDSHIYIFDKFELDETAGLVRSGEEVVNLTTTERELLVFLTKNPEKIFSINDLYEEIFGLEGRSKQNTIPAHISNLKKKLRVYSDNDFIVNVPNAGYRFDAKVVIKLKSGEIPIITDSDKGKAEDTTEIQTSDKIESSGSDLNNFEKQKILSNTIPSLAAPVKHSIEKQGSRRFIKHYVFITSVIILIITIFVVQKLFFGANDEEEIQQVIKESQLYESLMLYTNPKTFEENLLDKYWLNELDANINTDRNRIREAVLNLKNKGQHYGEETKCEQLEFQSIEVNKDGNYAVVKTLEKWFVAVYFDDGTLERNKTVGPYFVSYILRKVDGKWLIEKSTTARMGRPVPRIDKIEIISEPKSRQQFFVKITGEEFEPETVLIEVVGEGCPESKPCKVPNSALRENSKMSETVLDNVPLTLAEGNFKIFARNGDSQISNSVLINLPF